VNFFLAGGARFRRMGYVFAQMAGRIKQSQLAYPPLTWAEREKLWERRERDLLLDRKAAWEGASAEHELRMEAQARVKTLEGENARLRKRVEELETRARQVDEKSAKVPAFVKANVAKQARKPPGRKQGHVAALRSMPAKIDQVIDIPLARDERGRELCPRCQCPLTDLNGHDRIVEDVKPPELDVTKFKTRSGHCIKCDCRVESRAAHQPPAPISDLPHGQVGINALSIGLMLRIRHRLPFRQIVTILDRLAGLKLCAGALVKQMKRIAKWLNAEYQKLIVRMRASKVIHADETSWRIDGQNAWTWVFTQPLLTLFVIDKSRGGQVVKDVLGEAFNGTLISDFYGAYDGLDCPKQRCLTHLLRELKTEGEKDEQFAGEGWVIKLKKWCQDAIAHKKKWATLSNAKYEQGASRMEDRLDELIKTEPMHVQAKRLRKRLIKHRPDLTRFLWDEQVEPTNNPAERALRPMVVARKITGGSRSTNAAEAWSKLSSILATQEQNGKNVLSETKKLLTDYWAAGR
jgi:transposase